MRIISRIEITGGKRLPNKKKYDFSWTFLSNSCDIKRYYTFVYYNPILG